MEELEQRLSSLQSEYDALNAIHSDYKVNYKQTEKELTEKCDKLEQSAVEIAELEKLLLAKNLEITEKIQKLQEQDKVMSETEEKWEAVVKEKVLMETEVEQLQTQVKDLMSGANLQSMEITIENMTTGKKIRNCFFFVNLLFPLSIKAMLN